MIGTVHTTDFRLSEDDFHNDTVIEGEKESDQVPAKQVLIPSVIDTTFLPQIDQGSIKLLDHKTWSIIDV